VPVDPALIGRVFPPTPPHDVSRVEVSRFADAVGDSDPVHHDVEVARSRGHRDVPAPPTFPIVIAFEAMTALLASPDVGIELRHVVHAAQRFESVRPIVAGDVLTATLTVESVRTAAGTDLIATRSDVATVDGKPVCVAYATLAHRAPERVPEQVPESAAGPATSRP
jgi:acyl dehydratase